ncbi:hypothetical protein, partial [Streptomyces sp. NPDC056730]
GTPRPHRRADTAARATPRHGPDPGDPRANDNEGAGPATVPGPRGRSRTYTGDRQGEEESG